jgi:hypothetical protein
MVIDWLSRFAFSVEERLEDVSYGPPAAGSDL